MEFQGGMDVFSADKQKIGIIDRVVIDPRTKEVTHLVVRKGLLFKEDKVISVDLVADTTEEHVTLQESECNLELSRFEERNYIRLADKDKLYMYPSVETSWWAQPGLVPSASLQFVRTVKRNIPQNAIALQKGAEVIDTDGEPFGKVIRVVADSDSDHVTHIIISGKSTEREILVPATWIDDLTEDKVYLVVGSELLERLPTLEYK